MLSFGLQVGVFYTFIAALPQFLSSWLGSREIGLGILYQVSGIIGTYLSGNLLDKLNQQYHRWIIHGLIFGAIIGISVFAWSVTITSSDNLSVFEEKSGVNFDFYQPSRCHLVRVVQCSCILLGFCLAGLNTVGLEYGTALSFPANEAAIFGMMECVAELAGFLMLTCGGRIQSQNDEAIIDHGRLSNDTGSITVSGETKFISLLLLGLISSHVLFTLTSTPRSKRPQ